VSAQPELRMEKQEQGGVWHLIVNGERVGTYPSYEAFKAAKMAAYKREYYRKNKDALNAWKREYRQENREKLNAQQRIYLPGLWKRPVYVRVSFRFYR
jgi:hypothetical protein